MDSLRGALGKTSGRSYKAAPRQLLQVGGDPASPSATSAMHISKDSLDGDVRQDGLDAAKQAAKMGAEHLGTADVRLCALYSTRRLC
jgi:DNA topoisomerase 2-associated protein PAT1